MTEQQTGFQIDDNSMAPVLLQGEKVLCEEIQIGQIQDGKIYAILHGGASFIFYVHKVFEAGKLFLRLSPANWRTGQGLLLDVNADTRAFKIVQRFTSN